jgi:hypothetical protein
VLSCGSLPTFRQNVLPLSSRFKSIVGRNGNDHRDRVPRVALVLLGVECLLSAVTLGLVSGIADHDTYYKCKTSKKFV